LKIALDVNFLKVGLSIFFSLFLFYIFLCVREINESKCIDEMIRPL